MSYYSVVPVVLKNMGIEVSELEKPVTGVPLTATLVIWCELGTQ